MDDPNIPTLEAECLDAARSADGNIDFAVFQAEYERRLAERHERLMGDARAVFRAVRDWGAIKTDADWQAAVAKAREDLETGGFLIERLGAERYRDPALMALLLVLRRRLIDEHGVTSAAELMMVDAAVLSYYHTLRVNGWIGNLAQRLEAEFFRKEGLSVNVQGQTKSSWDVKIRGLHVEEIVERLGQQLMPLLDRSNRMMLRNLKALRERGRGSAPSVSIGSAGQVNVAAQQVNTGPEGRARPDTDAAEPTADPADGGMKRP